MKIKFKFQIERGRHAKTHINVHPVDDNCYPTIYLKPRYFSKVNFQLASLDTASVNGAKLTRPSMHFHTCNAQNISGENVVLDNKPTVSQVTNAHRKQSVELIKRIQHERTA